MKKGEIHETCDNYRREVKFMRRVITIGEK